MANPYAYYDDEPLPMKSRQPSVSSDGEEEPDMEPRCPLEMKGRFVAFFRLAVRTYRLNVTWKELECRLPNGEFLHLSREEAREQISVHGETVHIVVSDYRTYNFRCFRRVHDLSLARLKVWLMPPQPDAEKAHRAVSEQLTTTLLGPGFIGFIAVFLVWLVLGIAWDFHTAMNPAAHWSEIILSGNVVVRTICFLLYSLLLITRLWGWEYVYSRRLCATLPMIFPVWCFFAVISFPDLVGYRYIFFYFDVWFPGYIYALCLRWRRCEKQLQRENGLI